MDKDARGYGSPQVLSSVKELSGYYILAYNSRYMLFAFNSKINKCDPQTKSC